jgi:hypothetical protein
MDTRAFKIGFTHGRTNSKENTYKRKNKILEYETGFGEGNKQFMKNTIKNKPQLYHNSVADHSKKRLTISISGGMISDVVRENTDCELIIHDYDIDDIDPEMNKHCKQDIYGNWYQIVKLD